MIYATALRDGKPIRIALGEVECAMYGAQEFLNKTLMYFPNIINAVLEDGTTNNKTKTTDT